MALVLTIHKGLLVCKVWHLPRRQWPSAWPGRVSWGIWACLLLSVSTCLAMHGEIESEGFVGSRTSGWGLESSPVPLFRCQAVQVPARPGSWGITAGALVPHQSSHGAFSQGYQGALKEQGLVLASVMVTSWPCRYLRAGASHWSRSQGSCTRVVGLVPRTVNGGGGEVTGSCLD